MEEIGLPVYMLSQERQLRKKRPGSFETAGPF